MSQDLSKFKRIIEMSDTKEADAHLRAGWTLISIGFDKYDETSQLVIVLGNTSPDAKQLDPMRNYPKLKDIK